MASAQTDPFEFGVQKDEYFWEKLTNDSRSVYVYNCESASPRGYCSAWRSRARPLFRYFPLLALVIAGCAWARLAARGRKSCAVLCVLHAACCILQDECTLEENNLICQVLSSIPFLYRVVAVFSRGDGEKL